MISEKNDRIFTEYQEKKFMKEQENTTAAAQTIALGALIAAIYVVLTMIFAPISFGPIQVRIAESLTAFLMFTPAAVPGLFVGCLIANILGGAVLPDVIFGSLATLIGAVLGRKLFDKRWLFPIPMVLSNALIIPFVLRYGYGVEIPIPLMMVYIAIGEIIGCYILGEILVSVLLKYGKRIVRSGDE